MGGLASQPSERAAGSERSKTIAALQKDPVNIGLEIERLREPAEILEMRVALALHMPIAAADPDADGVVNLV